jgi:hypothetical protein
MGQCCTAGSRLYPHKRVFDRETALCFRVEVRRERPLAQGIEIALEMRRIHGADDGRVHGRVAECNKPQSIAVSI